MRLPHNSAADALLRGARWSTGRGFRAARFLRVRGRSFARGEAVLDIATRVRLDWS